MPTIGPTVAGDKTVKMHMRRFLWRRFCTDRFGNIDTAEQEGHAQGERSVQGGTIIMGIFENGWSTAGGAIMAVVMLAVLALIVVGIILLVRGLALHDHVQPGPPQGPAPSPGNKSALQVLEERYARGEIQREEFLQRKQDLLGG
jgi:putative membrane protein